MNFLITPPYLGAVAATVVAAAVDVGAVVAGFVGVAATVVTGVDFVVVSGEVDLQETTSNAVRMRTDEIRKGVFPVTHSLHTLIMLLAMPCVL